MSPSQSENLMTITRIQELEAASRRQRRILEDIQEALNDMNINTANTSSRLNVLEAIAKRQREVNFFEVLTGDFVICATSKLALCAEI